MNHTEYGCISPDANGERQQCDRRKHRGPRKSAEYVGQNIARACHRHKIRLQVTLVPPIFSRGIFCSITFETDYRPGPSGTMKARVGTKN